MRVSLLGTIVRNLRQNKGWSAAELARNAGIDKSVVSRLETGTTRSVHNDTLKAIAGALSEKPELLERLKNAGYRTVTEPLTDWEDSVIGPVKKAQFDRSSKVGQNSAVCAYLDYPHFKEYRISYKARNYEGTASCLFAYLVQMGLDVRRIYIGSTELRSNPDDHGIEFNHRDDVDSFPIGTTDNEDEDQNRDNRETRRAIFKVRSPLVLDKSVAEKDIRELIEHHYSTYFPDHKINGEQDLQVTVEELDPTKRIHFSLQVISADRPGVVESILKQLRDTKIWGLDLGLISFILVPIYERRGDQGPTSLLDIRGFADHTYLCGVLTKEGRMALGDDIVSEIDKRLREGSQYHYAWSVQATNPRGDASTYSADKVAEPGVEANALQQNWRIEYRAPNVPGTAWKVATFLNKQGFNIRRTFIGETNVAFQNPDKEAYARGRINVFQVKSSTSASDKEIGKVLEHGVASAIAKHFADSFRNWDKNQFAAPQVIVSLARYDDKYYFGLQIRLRDLNSRPPLRSLFMRRLTEVLFTDTRSDEWRLFFPNLPKPRINIERLVFLADYTGKLHREDSKIGDDLIDVRLGIKELWAGKDQDFRFRFAKRLRQWLCYIIQDLDDVVAFVGVRALSPEVEGVCATSTGRLKISSSEE